MNNMLRTSNFKNLLTIALLLVCVNMVQAGIISSQGRIYTSSLASPVVVSTATAATYAEIVPPFTSGAAFTDHSVLDMITLGVDQNNSNYITTSGEIKVNLKIEKYNTSGSVISTSFQDLILEYNPYSYSTPYVDKSVFTFNGSYHYAITINTITVAGTIVSTLPANLFINADIQVERYYNFASIANSSAGIPTSISQSIINTDCDVAGTNDEIKITWDKCFTVGSSQICPEEFQLEWTFVNDYESLVPLLYKNPTALNYDFRNNSTRITTANGFYNISLAFEHGYLLYRVRAVGRSMTDPTQSIYGQWSVAESGTIASLIAGSVSSSYYNTIEHEGNKNWQYSTTYAEEGKKKEVISYFDGSLRNRQSVTKVNSEKNTIVGETIYDYQGRPAINVLPVPVPPPPVCPGAGTDIKPALKFYPTFNQDNATNEYSRINFDEDAADRCKNDPAGMSTNSGASNYYSPANPVQTGAQAFVPDATGPVSGTAYPFTQIEYTPDNTGRIRAQGGVGFDYQLGQGHETKYFYGQPFQPQLDRMFGSEAGDAAHYKKNVVVDANGQVSISYLDQEGRTIATSLAGDAPQDASHNPILTTIPSGLIPSQNLTIDLFSKDANGVSNVNTVNTAADAIVFNTQLTVDNQSDFIFNYSLNVSPYTNSCLQDGICFSCVYDLEIKVKDDCGNDVPSYVSGLPPIIKKVGHFNPNVDGSVTFLLDCSGSSTLSESETFTLPQMPVGNYTVSKILTVDHAARDFYVNAYLDPANNPNCFQTLGDFQAAALAKVDTSGCHISCVDCAKSLEFINGVDYYPNAGAARDAFVAAGNGTEMDFDILLEECGAPCKTTTWCEATYQQLLSDVSPDGQYAEFQTSDNILSPGSFPLSVLNTSNVLPRTISAATGAPGANWTNPVIEISGTTYHVYLDEDGTRSIIHIAPISGGGFSPSVTNNDFIPGTSATYIKYDAAGNFYYTYPENLANLSDFVANWNSNWAKSLVQYHPEYCYYESCIKYSELQVGDAQTSDALDELLNNTTTYSDAVSKNLIVASYGTTAPMPAPSVDQMIKFTYPGSSQKDPFEFNTSIYGPFSASLDYKVHHFQTFGSTTYSMAEVAAITARCGTMFGTTPSTLTCRKFGQDVGSVASENTRIRDLEWNMFKNAYLSEKRKLQQTRADVNGIHFCKEYNGCIGNADYNPFLSGMVGAGSGFGFGSSPYFDEQQPCSAWFRSLYLNKIKRFIGPDDIHSPSPAEMDYQMYLQTGQCPLAVDLQTLLSGLATHGKLDNASGEDLTVYGEFTNDMYVEVSGGTPPSTFIPYLWKGVDLGSTLKANFYNTLTNTNVCSVILDKTGTGIAAWDNIVSLSQLKYTSTSSGLYNFTVMATVVTGSSTTYKLLTGSTCVKITGCSFPPQCDANDLAKDLSTLMSALIFNHQLNSTVDLSTPAATYPLLLTTNIKTALGTTNNTLKWNFVGGTYELFDVTAPSKKLIIKFTSFDPSTYNVTNIDPSVKGFANIKSNNENFFTMEGVDASNASIVTIGGSVEFKDATGLITGVSMGNCGLPEPLTCQGDPNQLRVDLGNLLKDVLLKKPFTGNIDLTQSPEYTSLIQSYFPAGLLHTSSVDAPASGAGGYHETLTFTITSEAGNCELTLKHGGSNPARFFTDLTALTDITAYGTPGTDNNYYTFYAIGTYSTGKSSLTDTIFGVSCLPLQNCQACSDVPEPECVQCKEIRILLPYAICKNQSTPFNYTTEGCNGTPTLLWNFGDGTVSSTGSHIYADAGTYDIELSSVKSENCPQLLAKATVTVIDCGFPKPHDKQDIYFNIEDSLKLVTGVLVSDTAINAYKSYVTSVMAVDTINGWTDPADTSYVVPVDYVTYYANADKYSSATYNSFIKNFDKTIDSKLHLRSVDAFVMNYGNYTNCTKEYERYVRSVNKYNERAIASGYAQLTAIADTAFYNNGLCDSSKVFIKYLTAFPDNGQTPVNVKTFLTAAGSLPPDGPCKDLYNQYVLAYNAFVQAQASSNTCPQYPKISPLYSYDDFEKSGLCANAAGLTAFDNYVQSFSSPTTCPGSMPQVSGSTGVDSKTCQRLYTTFKGDIIKYNGSAYAMAHGYSLDPTLYDTYLEFAEAGLCDCVEKYLTYLESFIALPPSSATAAAVSIDHFSLCVVQAPAVPDPCSDAYSIYTKAISVYNAYVMAHPTLGLPEVTSIYKPESFTAEGFCYCIDAYVAFLQTIIDGTADLSKQNRDNLYVKLDIAQTCAPSIKPPCAGAVPNDTIHFPKPKYTNPCVEQQINLALANAQNAYNLYVDSLTTYIANAYTQHCLGALENFTANYNDKEYHFTLYYYDQAGNLVRTIPPEGFHPVNLSTSDALDPLTHGQRIIQDRTYGQHTFFTDHTMATTYEYNSLNQLVKQNMPDHDAMDIWEFALPNGLDSRLKITATQFVTSTKGYLSGYINAGTAIRGYLYTSDDGGASWTKMNDLVASDLKKVQMVSSTVGYAIGSNGIVLKTADGGTTWDMTQLYNGGVVTFNDLYFVAASSGIIVSNNGIVLKTIDGGITYNSAAGGGTSALPSTLNYSSITFDGTYFYVSGNDAAGITSQLFKGTVTGTLASLNVSWAQLKSIRTTDLTKIQMVNTTTGFAVGIDGTLIKTTDAGATWTTISTGTANNFKDVYFNPGVTALTDGVAIIDSVPGFGLIYKTTNGGAAWTLLSGHTGIYYNSFNFYQNDKGYAVANKGKMKRVVFGSTFGLVNIITPILATPLDIFAASFSDGDKGWIVGNSGTIYYTTNATTAASTGPAWTPLVTGIAGASASFKDIYFGAIGAGTPNNGILLGTDGKSYKIKSSGPTYTVTQINASQNFVDITSSPTKVFAFDKTGSQMYSVTKTGISGTAVFTVITNTGGPTNVPIGADIQSIAATTDANILVTGKNGDINIASISGVAALWVNKAQTNIAIAINDLQAAGKNTIYAVGKEGTMLQTTNGTDWKTLPTGIIEQLNAIKFNSTNSALTAGTKGLLAGNNGKLWRQEITPPSTVTLFPITTLTAENLNDVALNVTGFGYVAGNHGTLISIPDFMIPAPVTGVAITSAGFKGIDFVFGTTAVYTVGDHAAVFNYSTSSTTFTVSGAKIKSVFTQQLNDVNFVNTLNGYTVGDKDVIRHTNDGGATWQYVAPKTSGGTIAPIPTLNGVWTTQNDKAFIIGNGGYKANIGDPTGTTVPVGVTVTYNNTPVTTQNLYDIAIKDGKGYMVGAGATAYKTINNGLNWTAMTAVVPGGATESLRAIHIFQSGTKFMAVGSSKRIFCFDGTSFVSQAPPAGVPLGTTFNDVFFHDDRTGYVVGTGGIVLRCSEPTNVFTLGANLITWKIMPLIGPNGVILPAVPANVNVTTVDFASRYHGFLGGYFTTGTPINYARLVDDESKVLSTRFWYDRLGRMVLSQNTKQYNRKDIPTVGAGKQDYSYTLYDNLGRISEVGEKSENVGTSATTPVFSTIFGDYVSGQFNPNVINDSKYLVWVNGGVRREVTHTYYDDVIPGLGLVQENLRKRVSSVTYEDVRDNNPDGSAIDLTYQHATHYSYDIHGNVKTLWQDNKKLYDEALAVSSTIVAQRYKRVDYEYDLISGKVNVVRFQDGQPDAFYHFYEYDDDNRITVVYTSRYPQANTLINANTVSCNPLWEKEAKYKYYAHGPLARVEIGDNKTQAMDYAYTLQGWIKGVNSNTLNEHNDMGQDGLAGGTYLPGSPDIHKDIAKDAYGYTLNYRTNDYSPINTLMWSTATNRFESVTAGSDLDAARYDLFNGNISSMVTTIEEPKTYTAAANEFPNILPQGTAYNYDQLNRIMDMKAFINLDLDPTHTSTFNTWAAGAPPSDRYRNTFSYDANGNILTQTRADAAGNVFDNMEYKYATDVLGNKSQNRLYQVHDLSANTAATDDIDDQDQIAPLGVGHAFQNATANTTNNYRYDEIGNLTFDNQEEIAKIDWTVYGKIKRIIRKSASTKADLEFNYDASGNRISKVVKPHGSSFENGGIDNKALWTTTYYARDAQGNIMTTYKKAPAGTTGSFKVIERNIFGSSRLGTENTEIELIATVPTSNPFTRTLGNKHYEGSNHLGNVLVVFTDKKYARDDNSDGIVDYFQPDVISATDYYAFGMVMQGRNFSSQSYRYGYQGSEKDDEIKGDGNSYTTEYRIFDPRIARWLSIDPQMDFFDSPYMSMGNNPLRFNDILGNEFDDKSKPEAKAHKEGLDKRLDEVDKEIIKVEALFKKASEGEKTGLKDQLDDLKAQRSQVNDAIREFKKLDESKQMFSIVSFNGEGSFTGYDKDNKTVVFHIGDQADQFSAMGHEFKHGYQFLRGKISFKVMHPNDPGVLYDIDDEVEAYQREYALNPQYVRDKLNNDPKAGVLYHVTRMIDIHDNLVRLLHKDYLLLPSAQTKIYKYSNDLHVSPKDYLPDDK